MADDSAISTEQSHPPLGAHTRLDTRRTWWLSFVLLMVLGGAWAVATPIFASPDEPSQVIRAWSVADGQLLGQEFGPHTGPLNPWPGVLPHAWTYGLSVSAPGTYQNYGRISCLAFNPAATANCLSLGTNPRSVPSLTYHGRYSPAYYAVVGLPSLFSPPGARQVYLMRLVSVLLAAGLLASAIATTRRAPTQSLAAAGVVVAITPMVLFFAASVNPSGLEIAAAIAVWTSGTLLAQTATDGIDGRVVDRLGIAAVALAVARPLGPLWVGVIGVVLALVAGFSCLRTVARSSRVRVWFGVLLGATVLHLGWNIWAQTYDSRYYVGGRNPGLSLSEIARSTTGKGFDLLHQMIGVFGWLDTPVPALTIVIWLFALGGLVGLALAVAPRRAAVALGIVAVLTMLLPIVLEGMQARQIGFVWQGRYTLPIAVGVPILAAFSVSGTLFPHVVRRRLASVLIVGLAIAHVLAFGQALRRYSVGANGTVWFFTQALWDPPIPGILLVLIFAVAMVLFLCHVLLPGGATSDSTPRSDRYRSARVLSIIGPHRG